MGHDSVMLFRARCCVNCYNPAENWLRFLLRSTGSDPLSGRGVGKARQALTPRDLPGVRFCPCYRVVVRERCEVCVIVSHDPVNKKRGMKAEGGGRAVPTSAESTPGEGKHGGGGYTGSRGRTGRDREVGEDLVACGSRGLQEPWAGSAKSHSFLSHLAPLPCPWGEIQSSLLEPVSPTPPSSVCPDTFTTGQ